MKRPRCLQFTKEFPSFQFAWSGTSWSICIKSGSPKAEVKTVMSRVKSSLFILLMVAFFWANATAWAQVDPSTSILLRNGNSGPAPEALDTQRYKVRELKSREAPIEVDEEKSGTTIPTPVTSKTSVNKVKAVSDDSKVENSKIDDKTGPVNT